MYVVVWNMRVCGGIRVCGGMGYEVVCMGYKGMWWGGI